MKYALRRIVRTGLVGILMITLAAGTACDRIHINIGPTDQTYQTEPTTDVTETQTTTESTKTPAETTGDATEPTTTAAPTTAPTFSTIADYFGNLNGNLTNGGFAAYDIMTGGHILAAGTRLLRYDPFTGDTETLATMAAGGITHINVGTEYYYFISSGDGCLYRLPRDGGNPECLANGYCTYAARYGHYVQVLMDGQMFWISESKDDGPQSLHLGQVNNVSLGYDRVFYLNSDGIVRLCSSTGMGKTTVYDGSGFVAMHQMFQSDDMDLICVDADPSGSGENIFAIADSTMTPVLSSGYAAIPSLNYDTHDGSYYFIAEGNDGVIIARASSDDPEPQKLADLTSSDFQLNLVNGVLYLQSTSGGQLHRFDIDERTVDQVYP